MLIKRWRDQFRPRGTDLRGPLEAIEGSIVRKWFEIFWPTSPRPLRCLTPAMIPPSQFGCLLPFPAGAVGGISPGWVGILVCS